MVPKVQSGQSKKLAKKLGWILPDSQLQAERATGGKYRCRECGMLFETLEEHDLHCRRVHFGEELCSFTGAII